MRPLGEARMPSDRRTAHCRLGSRRGFGSYCAATLRNPSTVSVVAAARPRRLCRLPAGGDGYQIRATRCSNSLPGGLVEMPARGRSRADMPLDPLSFRRLFLEDISSISPRLFESFTRPLSDGACPCRTSPHPKTRRLPPEKPPAARAADNGRSAAARCSGRRRPSSRSAG
jgi:hypothetical protein